MIDYKTKDRILNDFISIGIASELNLYQYADFLNLKPDELDIILEQFVEFNLISINKYLGGRINIRLKAAAFDFVSHGGFTAHEQLLKQNIQKLLLEIESLKPSLPDKVNTITTIASNIATALGLFLTK